MEQAVTMIEMIMETSATLLLLMSPIGFVLGSIGVIYSEHPELGWLCLASSGLAFMTGAGYLVVYSEVLENDADD